MSKNKINNNKELVGAIIYGILSLSVVGVLFFFYLVFKLFKI